jgi:hypothetical protein
MSMRGAPTRKGRSKQVKKIGLLIIASYALSAPAYACGWYLMMPIFGRIAAPIAGWQLTQSFDTAKECSIERDDLLAVVDQFGKPEETPTFHNYAQVFRNSQCIASDDPRLAR